MNFQTNHPSTRARVAMGLFAIALTPLLGTPAGASEVSATQVTRAVEQIQSTMRAQGEAFVQTRLWEATQSSLEEVLCVGHAYQDLPVLGECPDEPGYVTIGIATCHQPHKIPRRLVFREVLPGVVRLVCELDYANALPTGNVECDYSRCTYIEEPTWPLP